MEISIHRTVTFFEVGITEITEDRNMKFMLRFLFFLFLAYLGVLAIGFCYATIRDGRLYGFSHFSSSDSDFARSAFLAGLLTVLSLASLLVRLWPGAGPIQSGISLFVGIPLFGIAMLSLGDRVVSSWMFIPLLLPGLPILMEILRLTRR